MLRAPSLALPVSGALSSERVLRLRDTGGEVGIQGPPLRGLRGGVCPSLSSGGCGVSWAAQGQEGHQCRWGLVTRLRALGSEVEWGHAGRRGDAGSDL